MKTKHTPRLLGLTAILYVCIVLVVSACASTASNTPSLVSVSGQVLKPDTTPVAGATVYTIPATISTLTDENGEFVLNNIGGPGEYTIVASHEGLNETGSSKITLTGGKVEGIPVYLSLDVDLESEDGLAVPTGARGRAVPEG